MGWSPIAPPAPPVPGSSSSTDRTKTAVPYLRLLAWSAPPGLLLASPLL